MMPRDQERVEVPDDPMEGPEMPRRVQAAGPCASACCLCRARRLRSLQSPAVLPDKSAAPTTVILDGFIVEAALSGHAS